jgi:hypothetical protein
MPFAGPVVPDVAGTTAFSVRPSDFTDVTIQTAATKRAMPTNASRDALVVKERETSGSDG